MVERRAYERVSHQLRLTVEEAGKVYPGWSVDLCEGGLLIVCGHALAIGARIRLRLHLLHGSVTMPVRVQRTTEHDGQQAFGVCFLHPSPHVREVVRATVAEEAMRQALGNVTAAPRPRVESHVRLRVEDLVPVSNDGRATSDGDDGETG